MHDSNQDENAALPAASLIDMAVGAVIGAVFMALLIGIGTPLCIR